MSAGYLRQCARKQRFDTKALAQQQKAYLCGKDGMRPDVMKVYRCNQCGGYHVGHAWRPARNKAKRERWKR